MTREEIINEINCLLSELDNGEDAVSYLTQNDVGWLKENVKALEQEQGTSEIQAIYTEALEEGIRCAMCTNAMKSEKGCDGGCVVDTKMYNKVMAEINSRLLRKIPWEGHWIKEKSIFGWDGHSYQCSECGRSIHLDTEMEDLDDYPYCHCGAKMQEVEE